MGFNSHLHVLVTEGGFDKRGRFVHQKIIPFKSMRRTWQYQLLTRFKAALPKNRANSMLIHLLFKNHPEGFVVYLPKEMIRHYGAYSRRTKRKHSGYLQRSLRQATFEDFITKANSWAPKCPNCGRKVTLILYEKGPPIENEVFGCKLADWNHPMLSLSYN